jgi:hypothetical protein
MKMDWATQLILLPFPAFFAIYPGVKIVKNQRYYQARLLDVLLCVGGIAAASISLFALIAGKK